MRAPFPWFGGKTKVVGLVWERLGRPRQYIEPFCGSAAMLLGNPHPASLEVVNDLNGFLANFWRAVKHQPGTVAEWADYPVSHIDLGARHRWLMEQRDRLGAELQDPNWPGCAQVAGWWLWGQCCWIGSGWCDWFGKIPHSSDAGRGVQAIGQIPHSSDAGMGALMTSGGRTAWVWLHKIADRLERCRVLHGSWDRCLNHHYGGTDTAAFLDPPYVDYEGLYGAGEDNIAHAVAEWARENEDIRIALCGHAGDYDLPGWDEVPWSRGGLTYGGSTTQHDEVIWFSPGCAQPSAQLGLFG